MESFELLAPQLYRLQVPFPGDWTGVTLVRGEKNVLIDTGGCAETVDSAIVPALKEMGLTLNDMDAVLLTHTHGDHIGGLPRIRALAPDIHVAAYAPMADKVRNPLIYMKRIRGRFPGFSSPPSDSIAGCEPDILLNDGEKLYGYLRLIYTPGHDDDAVCFMDERCNALITGDSLQLNGTRSQGSALCMFVGDYLSSVERLLAEKPEYIIAGHEYLPLGGFSKGQKDVMAYLRRCRELIEFYRGFVRGMQLAGNSDPAAIARALIHEIGSEEPQKLCLPLYTVTQLME